MQLFSEKSQAVLIYLQDHQGEDLTAATISEALDMPKASVNGTLTGLQRATATHPSLLQRVEVEGVEGKVIRLTPEGIAADPYAEKTEPAKDVD